MRRGSLGIAWRAGTAAVPPDRSPRCPRRDPAEWRVPPRQEDESDVDELLGGRMRGSAADRGARVTGMPELLEQRGSIPHRATRNVANRRRARGRAEQATRLGQGDDADQAGQSSR